MDLWQFIKNDHLNVDQIFEQILKEGEGAVSRDKLFAQLKRELEAHTKIEEDVFYPALEQHQDLREMAGHARREHGEVKQMLQDLSLGKATGAEWMSQFQKLQENVQHHVREEEDKIIPAAQKAIDGQKADELLHAMERDKIAVLKAAAAG
jgi:iron-sulfur cluster repair protein YtfE (RIC family)